MQTWLEDLPCLMYMKYSSFATPTRLAFHRINIFVPKNIRRHDISHAVDRKTGMDKNVKQKLL